MFHEKFRPQLHDTGLLSERHQILVFQGAFHTYYYDNMAGLNKNYSYEKLSDQTRLESVLS